MGKPTLDRALENAGLDRVRCPNCQRNFPIKPLVVAVFEAILEHVAGGFEVRTGIGSFKPITRAGQKHKTPITPNGRVAYGETTYMGFRQSAAAKRRLADDD